MKPTIPKTQAAWGLSVPVLTRDQARAARMKPVTYAFPHKQAALLEAAALAAEEVVGHPTGRVAPKRLPKQIAAALERLAEES